MGYNTKNYGEQGGERTVIGGSLDVVSGGEIDIESGGSIKIAGTDVTTKLSAIPAITTQTAIADISTEAVDAAQNTAINGILAALRAAKIIATGE